MSNLFINIQKMNNQLPTLRAGTYARDLLEYLQKHPKESVKWSDFLGFMNTVVRNRPFLWQYPTSRLSELKSLWLVDYVGTTKNILKERENIFLYRINERGLNYKLN